MKSKQNTIAPTSLVSYKDRCLRQGQVGMIVWFTGLSGSGKTTIARQVEKHLFDQGRLVYHLDGDSLRQGLNNDLGFSLADRKENIRRAAEVARLFHNAGIIVLASFISPQRELRAFARSIVKPGTFLEVYVRASLSTCMERDPKGFYRKALAGEIKDYTGLTQEYEEPLSAELVLDTETLDLDQCVQLVFQMINSHLAK